MGASVTPTMLWPQLHHFVHELPRRDAQTLSDADERGDGHIAFQRGVERLRVNAHRFRQPVLCFAAPV